MDLEKLDDEGHNFGEMSVKDLRGCRYISLVRSHGPPYVHQSLLDVLQGGLPVMDFGVYIEELG